LTFIYTTGPKKAAATSLSESALFTSQPKKSAKKSCARVSGNRPTFYRPTKFFPEKSSVVTHFSRLCVISLSGKCVPRKVTGRFVDKPTQCLRCLNPFAPTQLIFYN